MFEIIGQIFFRKHIKNNHFYRKGIDGNYDIYYRNFIDYILKIGSPSLSFYNMIEVKK